MPDHDDLESPEAFAERLQGPWVTSETRRELANAIRARDAAVRAEALREVREALALVDRYADCGDNSCHFLPRPRGGMRTNGGCRCVERGGAKPGLVPALANLVRVVRALTEGSKR